MCVGVSQIEYTKYRVTSLSFTDEGMWSNQNSENELELRTIKSVNLYCSQILVNNLKLYKTKHERLGMTGTCMLQNVQIVPGIVC